MINKTTGNIKLSMAILSAVVVIPLFGATSKPDRERNETAQQGIHSDTIRKGLKDYYKGYFPIGVAVNMNAISGKEADLIEQEFSSVTPENDMKMGPIHPTQYEYNWKNADAIVDFAQKHHIRVRGDNLLWHNQAPAWMFRDSSDKLVTKAVLLKRLKDPITTVVKHFKGKIYAWDVVNEAIDDNPSVYLRNSLWYQVCGEDFIPKAFEYAHETDPSAALYYNDYNSEVPSKRDKICVC